MDSQYLNTDGDDVQHNFMSQNEGQVFMRNPELIYHSQEIMVEDEEEKEHNRSNTDQNIQEEEEEIGVEERVEEEVNEVNEGPEKEEDLQQAVYSEE